MPQELPGPVRDRLGLLPAGLQEHVDRVRALARELAAAHGVDSGLVDLSAAAHDLARAMTDRDLLLEARRLGLDISEVEEKSPILLHGPIAAVWLSDAGITEERVIQAVRWHTSGIRNMDVVGRVVFLADKLEPHKVARWAALAPLLPIAKESLDEALRGFLDLSIVHHIHQRHAISLETLDLRNSLLTPSRRNP
ncbi:MAG: HD domain-containing protein [SAR202 cluster bacterium]|nr:HD domain-containing protein [SAR202 cluster bacterium]